MGSFERRRRFVWSCLIMAHVTATTSIPVVSPVSGCRCVPDQWEGVLSTSEHEVDVFEGQHNVVKSKVVVHYDYTKQLFATEDLLRNRRSVADYLNGVVYTVDKNGCRAMTTSDRMRRMCFPADATRVTTVLIGAKLPAFVWQFVDPGNVTIRTISTADSCIPISEEVVVTESDYISLTSTLYSDVTIGIQDPDVFRTPYSCQLETGLSTAAHDQEQSHHLSDGRNRQATNDVTY